MLFLVCFAFTNIACWSSLSSKSVTSKSAPNSFFVCWCCAIISSSLSFFCMRVAACRRWVFAYASSSSMIPCRSFGEYLSATIAVDIVPLLAWLIAWCRGSAYAFLVAW